MGIRDLLLVFPLLALGCAGVDNGKPTGTWERQIKDEDLGESGVERMTFRDDSIFVHVNEMSLKYRDSTFVCDFGYYTTVSGRWEREGKGIRMFYDIATFSLDTIADRVRVSAGGECVTDSIVSPLIKAVKAELSEYYRSTYQPFVSPGGLELSNLSVDKDELFALVNDSIPVFWKKANAM